MRKSFQIDIYVSWHVHHCTPFCLRGSHLAVVLHIFQSRKIRSAVYPEILVCWANPFPVHHVSSFVHCLVMATDCLCEWTEFSWYFHILMHAPTLEVFRIVRHNHPVLHVALHGTLLHFCSGELHFHVWMLSHFEMRSPVQLCWRWKWVCTPLNTSPSGGNFY